MIKQKVTEGSLQIYKKLSKEDLLLPRTSSAQIYLHILVYMYICICTYVYITKSWFMARMLDKRVYTQDQRWSTLGVNAFKVRMYVYRMHAFLMREIQYAFNVFYYVTWARSASWQATGAQIWLEVCSDFWNNNIFVFLKYIQI